MGVRAYSESSLTKKEAREVKRKSLKQLVLRIHDLHGEIVGLKLDCVLLKDCDGVELLCELDRATAIVNLYYGFVFLFLGFFLVRFVGLRRLVWHSIYRLHRVHAFHIYQLPLTQLRHFVLSHYSSLASIFISQPVELAFKELRALMHNLHVEVEFHFVGGIRSRRFLRQLQR